jgi:hypothetical protein
MNFKLFGLQTFAVVVSCLVFNIAIVSATNINIIFDGTTQETVEYETGNLINTATDVVRDPSDIAWTDIKIKLIINSASLSHTIKKIYIYKCKSLNPVSCSQLKPEEYDNFANIELSWSDISQREGSSRYPEVANLMVLVNLEGPYESSSWIGLMETINRVDYNIFTVTEDDIDTVSLYAKSSAFIQPIKTYIENFAMIPFSWLERVVISGTSGPYTGMATSDAPKIYAVGGSGSDLESSPPQATSAIISSNQVSTISKEFYMIFFESGSGITSPVTLNLNPEFTCGNSICELSIGENQANCCYDCSCGEGQFCDSGSINPSTGMCKSLTDISLEIPSISAQSTECSAQETINIDMRVRNAPENLQESAEATFSIDGSAYSSECTRSLSTYKCPVTISSPASCGQGTVTLEMREITLTISYSDGPNVESRDLTLDSAPLNWNYDCSCGEDLYCDIGKNQCEAEDAISLGVTSITSYLSQYSPGDSIDVTAKIFNPPSDTVLIGASAQLNLTNGQVSPGTPVCSQPTEEFEYSCSIPFSITNYDDSLNYRFEPNTLIFQITYSDGSTKKTRTLSVSEGFYPISIPSKECGDAKVDTGETAETCCQDVGCPGSQYCDAIGSCMDTNSVTLSVDSVTPTTVEDCLVEHEFNILGRINNMPTDMSMDYYSYVLGGDTRTQMFCTTPSPNGLFECTLTTPPVSDCPLTGKVFSGNSLELNVRFPDGSNTKTLDLTSAFPDITLIPIYHCGEYECESELGENSSNCCIDCGCPSGEFCDYDDEANPDGICLDPGNINLVVDSPKIPVSFDTCERSNKVNVKTHIENSPSNMRVEQIYAIVDSNDARVFCKKESNLLLVNDTTPMTYNCTVYVPKISTCSQGEVYTYTDNSISFFIAYRDGESRKTLTKELSATLPAIELTQSYESLHDIISESVEEMQNSLDRTLEIAQAMMDWYESCLETAQALMWISMFTTVTSTFIGIWGMTGFKGHDNLGPLSFEYSGDKWSGRDVGQFISGVSQVTGTAVESWMKYCEMVSKMYELDMKIQDIKLEQIQMNLCIRTHQHTMDSGNCVGREEGCFNALMGCVNFNDVESWSNQLSNTLGQASSIGRDLGNSLSEMGEGFGRIGDAFGGGGRDALIRVKAAGLDINPGAEICEYDTGHPCAPTRVYATIPYRDDCKNILITLNDDFKRVNSFDFTVHDYVANYGDVYEVTLRFYCYDDQQNFFEDSHQERADHEILPSYDLTLRSKDPSISTSQVSRDNACGCPGGRTIIDSGRRDGGASVGSTTGISGTGTTPSGFGITLQGDAESGGVKYDKDGTITAALSGYDESDKANVECKIERDTWFSLFTSGDVIAVDTKSVQIKYDETDERESDYTFTYNCKNKQTGNEVARATATIRVDTDPPEPEINSVELRAGSVQHYIIQVDLDDCSSDCQIERDGYTISVSCQSTYDTSQISGLVPVPGDKLKFSCKDGAENSGESGEHPIE